MQVRIDIITVVIGIDRGSSCIEEAFKKSNVLLYNIEQTTHNQGFSIEFIY